jgi:prepilin peptidase CpaA
VRGVSNIGIGAGAVGLMVGFAITFVFFALGGMGAGDVKLFAGIGAWLGPVGVVQVFVIERVVGLVLVVAQAVRMRRLKVVVVGSAVLAANAVVTRDLRCASAEEGADEKLTRLPYAVPTLVAVVAVVAGRWRWM